MVSGYPEHDLREFIYLNDESVNSHLSSLGVGLETAQKIANVDEVGSSSRFAALVPTPFGGLSGSGEVKTTDKDESESQIDITAPYRFQELIRQIKDNHQIKQPEKENVNVEYGDVVAVEGIVSPLSLYRFEIAQDAVITMGDSTIAAEKSIENLRDVLKEHGLEEELEEDQPDDPISEPVGVREARTDVTRTFVSVSKGLTGSGVPVRLDSEMEFGGSSYGAVLDRDQLRVPEERAFFEPRKYTIFGRVESKVSEGKEWDPIDTTRVVESFATDDVGISEFVDMIVNVAQENKIEMKDEHLSIDGPATIIDPLAVYW